MLNLAVSISGNPTGKGYGTPCRCQGASHKNASSTNALICRNPVVFLTLEYYYSIFPFLIGQMLNSHSQSFRQVEAEGNQMIYVYTLQYWTRSFSITPPVRLSGSFGCHNFLKGREVPLACSYHSFME